MQGDKAVMIVAVFAAVALAITGALAVTCFVKAYGVSFASAPRSEAAANAKEVPAPMVFAQGLLAAICVVLGIGAPVIAPVLVDVAASVLHPYGGVFAHRGHGAHKPVLRRCSLHARNRHCSRGARRPCLRLSQAQDRRQGAEVPPWACGYAPNEHMPVVATTFASEVSWFMQPLYTLRDRCTAVCWSIAHFFQKLTGVAEAAEPVPDKVLVDAPHKGVEKLADLATKLEGGNYSIYICYIVAALVVFLVLAVQMG